MPGTISPGIVQKNGRSVTHKLLDSIIDTEIKNQYKMRPGLVRATDESVFNQMTTKSDQVTVQNYKSVGYLERMGSEEDYPHATIELGQAKALPVKKYGKALRIAQDFMSDDNMFNVTQKGIRDLARKAILTQDRESFGVYRNAQSSDDEYTTGDGQPLLSDSHVTLSGKVYDNKVEYASGDNIVDTIENMILQLEAQPNQDGTVGGWQPMTLLVPPALHKEVYQALESRLESNTDENQLNYYSTVFPGLKVVTTQFISEANGGSDTTMFMLADGHGVHRYVREGVSTDYIPSSANEKSDHNTYKTRFRELTISPTAEGVVGAVQT